MSAGTKIQWCDDTHNFWRGCVKVSPRELWGGTLRDRAKDFDAPLRWNKKPWICDECGTPHTEAEKDTAGCMNPKCGNTYGTYHRRRVFSLSLGDWLDDAVPIEWLADMLDVIRRCPNLDFLLLTKRPENFFQRVLMAGMSMMGYVDGQKSSKPEALPTHVDDSIEWVLSWSKGELKPHNVWIGCTVENQEYADKRIPELLKIPAVCRFLSYEPALGPVDFKEHLRCPACGYSKWDKAFHGDHRLCKGPGPGISWIIVGGESGPKARPFNIEWARSTVAQCRAASVACFVKQLGAKAALQSEPPILYLGLKDKKGGDISEWPDDLSVREFPKT